ncbi:MAG: hypothetical protein LBV41_06630 [Cytophagaceae bacterium]|nr:hypothetical protein [Cytophagaceae bacterium]
MIFLLSKCSKSVVSIFVITRTCPKQFSDIFSNASPETPLFVCIILLYISPTKVLLFCLLTVTVAKKWNEALQKKRASLSDAQAGTFFQPHVIPLQACFVEQREQLTNTALIQP